MPRVDLELATDLTFSPRCAQLQGMFDVPRAARATASFHFDVPLDQRPWQIGLITGPSGGGKSSVARALFGDRVIERYGWEPGRAIVDGFGELGIRETVAALSSVGFSSPPSWLKPYSVLSNGEKFRCDLARALVDPRELIVVDEFTSLVDRTVGRIGAHAVAKAVRAQPGRQFVAVTCHDDVIEWLQPDWVLEPHAGAFTWRSVQRRPTVELEVVRADASAWRAFHSHHYLSASLHKGARCFVGYVEGRLAAFAAVLPFPHPHVKNLVSLSRIVVLPDFQGLGLGAHGFVDVIAQLARANGKVLKVCTSHPALIRTWAKSAQWNMTRAPSFTAPPGANGNRAMLMTHSRTRKTAAFQWRGGSWPDVELAHALWASPSSAPKRVPAQGDTDLAARVRRALARA